MAEALFLGGLRSIFGRVRTGAYASRRPDDLLVELLRAQAAHLPACAAAGAEDLLVGCAYPEGEQGYNLGRMVALGAGIDCPGLTLNRLCGSSLEAAMVAAARVRAGFGRRYLVAGVESMSRVPRRGATFSPSEAITAVAPAAYMTMGATAEAVARRHPEIDRAAQEAFAVQSHLRAAAAYAAGHYSAQVVPLDAPAARDECLRVPVDRAKMAALPPAFAPDGVVTAATSSPLSDGAAVGWVVALEEARRLGCEAGLRVVDIAHSAIAPEHMGLGPIAAVRAVLRRQHLGVDDIAAFEINEAFAVQLLAVAAALCIPARRLNAWGGALALGHPLGASGLRLLMTLQARLALEAAPGAWGVASLCVGGGQGMAMLVQHLRP